MKEYIRFKKFIILFLFCSGVSVSAYGIVLNKEEQEEINSLKRHRISLQELEKKCKYSDKKWISPRPGALEELAKAFEKTDNPLPNHIFPKSRGWEKEPNMLGYSLESGEYIKIDLFQREMVVFHEALNKRLATGKGLTFRDENHLNEWKRVTDELTETRRHLHESLDKLGKIYKKYASKYNIIFLLFQSLEQEIDDPQFKGGVFNKKFENELYRWKYSKTVFFEPSLETETGTVEETFVKAKLFYDASQMVIANAFNLWGALAHHFALQYKEIGDDFLENLLPKKIDFEREIPEKF